MLALGLLAVTLAHSVNLAGWPRYFDDEGTYYSQAWAVQNLGALAPYTYWYDHPPVGWLQLAAFTWLPEMLIDGNSSLLAGRVVMVGYTVVAAGLVFLLGRRLGMGKGWALLAMLLWGLNPLVLFEGRQVFLDTIALPWLLGAFVLALNPGRNLALHMAAGLCFAIAVLSKETTLIFAPALLLAVWQSAYRPTRRFALVGFSAITAMTGAMYALFALIRSELFPGPDHVSLWDALAFQFLDREGSGFLLDPNGPEGGAYVTFSNWVEQDSFLLFGGVAAGVLALGVRRLRPVGLAIVIATLVALRPGGYLPQMYVVAVLPFCALALVGLADVAWQRARGMGGRALPYATAFVVLGTAVGATLPLADWRSSYRTAWTADTNDVQAAALRRLATLPEDARIAVDNTYWNDLVDQGRDRDDVVWFYKIDSDAAVLEDLGSDFRNLDYLVWTTYMDDNAGPVVAQAYEHTRLVWADGEGAARVEIRQVLSEAEETALREAERARVAAEVAASRRQFRVFLDAPSDRFPDLTNGQIAAIEDDSATATLAQLARRYETTTATVQAVLDEQ